MVWIIKLYTKRRRRAGKSGRTRCEILPRRRHDAARYRSMRELVGTRDNVVFSCGVHPLNRDEPWEVETLRALAAEEGVVAMGRPVWIILYPGN